jgi:hypothetical protein
MVLAGSFACCKRASNVNCDRNLLLKKEVNDEPDCPEPFSLSEMVERMQANEQLNLDKRPQTSFMNLATRSTIHFVEIGGEPDDPNGPPNIKRQFNDYHSGKWRTTQDNCNSMKENPVRCECPKGTNLILLIYMWTFMYSLD